VDDDGNRVQATENGTLTKFVGSHYEVTGSQVTKYYFAGTSRIAMRKYTVPSSMSVEYLLGDHLGSTSITTDSTGAKVSEMRYKPWGEVRYSWISAASTTPTYSLADYTFTGQYSYMDDPSTSGVTEGFDLMFYNARWYDPSLGRFAQADSIVPASQGVQGYDRYAYVSNNPVRYNDPSGHGVDCGIGMDCGAGDSNAKRPPICSSAMCDTRNHGGGYGNSVKVKTIDLIFEPYYGPYMEDLASGSITYEQLEDIDSVWNSAYAAYLDKDIDLKKIAANGEINPLTYDDVYDFLDRPASVQILMMDRTSHKPHMLFLQVLGEQSGVDLLGIDEGSLMQYEPNYLNALMEAHPLALDVAKESYQESFADDVMSNYTADFLEELLDNFKLFKGTGGP
jgi:RHS repeat-associated protein